MARLYLAYGSNLNKEQMAFRCPTARPIGAFTLYGYELVFRGVADIVHTGSDQSQIQLGMWEIEKADEKALDRYEGVKHGMYSKIEICGMLTYQMNTTDMYPPSTHYFNTILQGYHDFGLDTSHLYDAVGWSHHYDTFDFAHSV